MTNMSQLPFHFTANEIIKQGRTTQENLDIIKAWLMSDLPDHFIPAVQDEMIVIFLISCDNDIKLTKHTITMYYKCKKDGPDLFDERDVEREDIKKALNTVNVSNIPVRTEENYAIHYLNIRDSSYRAFDLGPIMKLCYMLVDLSLDHSIPHGLVIVFDMKGVGLMHLTRLKLDLLRKYFEFLQEALPMQLKAIHIINTVYFFDKIMSIIKVFMKKELVEMLQLHPPELTQEELFSLLPKKCWPEEYGGDLPSYSVLHEKTKKEFAEKQEFWRIEQEIRTRI